MVLASDAAYGRCMGGRDEESGNVARTPEAALRGFVEELARRRGVELPVARGDHVVAGALALCRGASADEVGLAIALLEQLRDELAARDGEPRRRPRRRRRR